MTLSESIKNLCDAMMLFTSHAQAAAVVDVSSGHMLGYSISPSVAEYFNDEHLQAVIQATVERFEGPSVKSVEALFRKSRRDNTSGAVERSGFTTKHTEHYMTRVEGYPNVVVAYIIKRQRVPSIPTSSIDNAARTIAKNLKDGGYGGQAEQ